MTDAITLLTTDHRAVEGLFARAEVQDRPDPGVVAQIVKELSIHDAIEREHLYPVVRERLEEAGLADHSVEEHNEVASDLAAVEHEDDDSPELVARMRKLIGEVRVHVEEEETRIFPALGQVLSVAELEDLGATLEKAKSSAPTRPHPHAPNEGLGTKVAGAVSAPLDKARDKIQGR